MLTAEWAPYRLIFNFEARTSRQVMTYKDTYFARVYDTDNPRQYGIGECALFKGLSADDRPDYEEVLAQTCLDPATAGECPYSSIRFGFETALYNLCRHDTQKNEWLQGKCGIAVNGLVWMGDKETMRRRIKEKIEAGFRVIKLKIGGINFNDEVELLREIRKRFSADTLEIRLDANGSFTPDNALARLDTLAAFAIHSIEQPLRAGQTEAMAALCRQSPVAIALDEELIGVRTEAEAEKLLSDIRPRYIILKPSLCGGFHAAAQYIHVAKKLDIGWWATSALESNIGLAAIAGWLTNNYHITMPQGLGTGLLYTNNIAAPLEMRASELYYNPQGHWEPLDNLQWQR